MSFYTRVIFGTNAHPHNKSKQQIYGLMKDCSIPIANALKILQSCIKPSEWSIFTMWLLPSHLNQTCSHPMVSAEESSIESRATHLVSNIHISTSLYQEFTDSGLVVGIPKPQGQKFLAAARDWKIAADLKEALHFPHHIVHTQERLDIVIWSDTVKHVIIVELTVPWKENIEEAFERKKLWYEKLRIECEDKGWQGVQPWALTKFPNFSLTFPWPFCGFPWTWDINYRHFITALILILQAIWQITHQK